MIIVLSSGRFKGLWNENDVLLINENWVEYDLGLDECDVLNV